MNVLFLNSIYAGHHSILIDPAEVEINSSVWMNTISHYKSKIDNQKSK